MHILCTSIMVIEGCRIFGQIGLAVGERRAARARRVGRGVAHHKAQRLNLAVLAEDRLAVLVFFIVRERIAHG